MSAELAENGARDLTTSKYARLEGHGPRNNEGRLKCPPLGDVSVNVQNTVRFHTSLPVVLVLIQEIAGQDLVATSRTVEPEYVRPIASKNRGNSTKQSAAAASPAGIPIRTTGGVSFAPVHVIPLKEEKVASPDQKEPPPTSDSSPSPETAVPNALGLSNVPAPVATDEPVRVVEETVVASTGSSSPKPQVCSTLSHCLSELADIVLHRPLRQLR
ncbi:hypothetical protein BKA62DRAFT_165232 [Auriculariales sp. MPI-PUGE-AT-0066]|nr:hypothetical protein BKA62DRAFT_165232 [Auriculariales sp. MPI-PUGE-AT-0066]